jgi:hypothetical protein
MACSELWDLIQRKYTVRQPMKDSGIDESREDGVDAVGEAGIDGLKMLTVPPPDAHSRVRQPIHRAC